MLDAGVGCWSSVLVFDACFSAVDQYQSLILALMYNAGCWFLMLVLDAGVEFWFLILVFDAGVNAVDEYKCLMIMLVYNFGCPIMEIGIGVGGYCSCQVSELALDAGYFCW